MAEATEENKPLLDYLKPLLVSAGGAVLGLLVMPVAIAQYPDFFNRNPWILPVSTAVAIICFVLPLPLDPRTRRISVKIASITYIGKPLLAIVCLGVIVGAVAGAIRLVRFHREH